MTDVLTSVSAWATVGPAIAALRSPAVRTGLVDTVAAAMRGVEEGSIDRVVVGARRMFCFVELLRDLGVPIPVDRFVSDRFLELLPDGEWRGLRAQHIDDTVVRGVTLQRNLATLRRLVDDAGQVTQRVGIPLQPSDLLADWDGVVEEAAVPEREAALRRTAGGDLHLQFAAVFGANLIPYFADFAVTRPEPVDPDVLDGLLASRRWQVADVTNAAMSGTGARAFSCFLCEEEVERFADEVGVPRALIALVKLRVFIHERQEAVQVRLVPIVLTAPLQLRGLDEAWPLPAGSGDPDRRAEAISGLIAFHLSRRLLAFVGDALLADVGWMPEEDEAYRRLVLGAIDDRLLDVSRLLPVHADASEPQPRWLTGSRAVVLVGDDEARPLAEMVLQQKRSGGDPRLPLSTISAVRIRDTADLSLAIDVDNDLGFVVPTQLVHGDGVERAYRAGELDPIATLRPGPGGGELASVRTTTLLDTDWIPLKDDAE